MDLESGDPYLEASAASPGGLSYSFYTPEEIRSLSILRLINPSSFDELGRPTRRGLYDPRLGPMDHNDGPCKTCELGYLKCPGHFGHIELPVPVIHPFLLNLLCKLLSKMCWNCHRLKYRERMKKLVAAKLRLLSCGDSTSVDWLMKWITVTEDAKAGRGAEMDEEDWIVWAKMLQDSARWVAETAPKNIRRYIIEPLRKARDTENSGRNGLDSDDEKTIDMAVVRYSVHIWRKCVKEGTVNTHSLHWDEAVEELTKSASKNCLLCKERGVQLRRSAADCRIYTTTGGGKEKPLSTLDIELHLKKFWEQERDICELLFGCQGRSGRQKALDYRIFLIYTVLVPPPKFRKWSKTGTMEYAAEHPQNIFYSRILDCSEQILKLSEEKKLHPIEISDVSSGGDPDSESRDEKADGVPDKTEWKDIHAKRTRLVMKMQKVLVELFDSKSPEGSTGIRQQLDGKGGLFRTHMMGKRVNYSGRSVIGPDLFLDTDEIGIPKSFAKHLTFPDSVTALNNEHMRASILNGPDKHPGANGVDAFQPNISLHSRIRFRSSMNKQLLQSQSSLLLQSVFPKRVIRHVKNGDSVLFNRQPTLHRSSLLAHRFRVLCGKEKTIRFHYANCTGYNADFDGDEMNMHVAQDHLARAELSELASADSHYISATSGEPIRGLIQDHVLSGVLLTSKDTFLAREVFTELLFFSVDSFLTRFRFARNQRVNVPIPAVLAPKELFTGKQLVSAVLHVILQGRKPMSLTFSAATKSPVIPEDENTVVFLCGQLLQGVLDKKALGSKPFGLVHAINEIYGGEISGAVLSVLGRLLTLFLRIHGHTTGIEDLILKEEAEEIRKSSLQSAGLELSLGVLSELEDSLGTRAGDKSREFSGSPEERGAAGNLAKGGNQGYSMGQWGRGIIENLLRRNGRIAEDWLDAAMLSGARRVKNEIDCACFPISGLRKPFPQNGFALMTSTGAKGSVVNSSQVSALLGQTTIEEKRVPRMGGSGRTLPTFEPFDPIPAAGGFIASRFLTGLAPHEYFFHCMAGREGLMDTSMKTQASGYLQRCLVKHLEGVRLQYDDTVRDSDMRVLQFFYGEDGLDVTKSAWLLRKPDFGLINKEVISSERLDGQRGDGSSPSKNARRANVRSCVRSELDTLLEKNAPGALSKVGAVSPYYQSLVAREGQNESDREYLFRRYQEAACSPGDNVGILAALGVGEPSTQMTLNTFHFAGMGAAHVTGGIPRLIEMIREAVKNPSTPSMKMPLAQGTTEAAANYLATRMTQIRLLDMLERFQMREEGSADEGEGSFRRMVLSLEFPQEVLYREKTGFYFTHMTKAVSTVFAYKLQAEIAAAVGRLSSTHPSVGSLKKFRFVEGITDFVEGSRGTALRIDEAEKQLSSWLQRSREAYSIRSKARAMRNKEAEEEDVISEVSSESDSDNNDDDLEKEHGNRRERKQSELTEFDGPEDSLLKGHGAVGSESSDAESDDMDGSDWGEALPMKDSLLKPVQVKCIDGSVIEIVIRVPEELRTLMTLSSIIKMTATKVMLSAIPNIKRCFVDRTSSDETISLATEGSNLRAMMQMNGCIDLNKMATNNLWEIFEVYGVEALRQALIRELVDTFRSQDVSYRHFTIIADYMTQDGGFRALNVHGMASVESAVQRMTFATSTRFLIQSTLKGLADPILSPSAAVSVGKLDRGGTGSFDLLQAL